MKHFILGLAGLAFLPAGAVTAQSKVPGHQPGVVANYWLYVANESSDLVSKVRFGPDGLFEEKAIPVGIMPADLDGAHGIAVSPDGRYWFVSLAHGTPYGKIWKFTTSEDQLIDSTTVGLFPATMAVTPDGSMLLGVNFNLHGHPTPSSVSAVFIPVLQEMQRIETCVKPHGSRVNHAGTLHYSGCIGDDIIVEISTDRLEVNRRLYLGADHERILADGEVPGVEGTRCSPTWVTVSVDDKHLFVPCNKRGEVLEINAVTLAIERRVPTGKGPYNADVSPDGSVLVVTLKGEQAVAVFDLDKMTERRIRTSQPITHGVVISPDSRYAFVTNESIGATPGTLDVIDLKARRLLATLPLHYQPGGIGFWRMTSADASSPGSN